MTNEIWFNVKDNTLYLVKDSHLNMFEVNLIWGDVCYLKNDYRNTIKSVSYYNDIVYCDDYTYIGLF